MTFKVPNRDNLINYQLFSGMLLFLIMSASDAQVSVNNIEKNDKVMTAVVAEPGDNKEPGVWALSAEQWELARNGESILSLPAINSLMNAWLSDKQKKIEIRYPGGEEGEFWVQELTDWLVSLGIPSNHMVVVTGSGAGDVIKFDLIK